MVSAMTGELIPGTALDGGYWAASLRAPVQFHYVLSRPWPPPATKCLSRLRRTRC